MNKVLDFLLTIAISAVIGIIIGVYAGYIVGYWDGGFDAREDMDEVAKPDLIQWLTCSDEKLKIEQMTQIVEALTERLSEVTEAPVTREEPKTLNSRDDIKKYITEQSVALGVDCDVSLRIAECESGFRNVCNVYSCDNGIGIYQILQSTFEEQCDGDVYNARDNIDCALKMLKDGQLWRWDQSRHCWDK